MNEKSTSALSEFTITATIQERRDVTVCRAIRVSDRRRVVLKILRAERPSPRQIERIRREYDIGKMFDLDEVVRTTGLTVHDGRLALVMEEFGDQTLEDLIGAPMDPGYALRIAVQLASALDEIHRRGVVHKDIKPANILVDTRTERVKIADFDTAVLSDAGQPARARPVIEGSLGYLSPEQTGRMNRTVDHRSDLYSLGVTLYVMLTGTLPFRGADPLEWVHCHVARTPPSPRELVGTVPRAVSDIVMKLLSKDADARYQTAAGLGADLAVCLSQLAATGEIAPFPLGARDAADRLRIPQRLYGRGPALTALSAALDRVRTHGRAELVLVSGASGIGKSSLVREVQPEVVRANGLFAEGKFDPHRRNVPYSAIVQALQDLLLQIAARGEEHVLGWRARLLDALGPGARAIADVVPPLTLLIGPQPPVPELPPIAAQNRLYMLFQRLLSALAAPDRPLLLFLDDLQWSDAASLSLLQRILIDPGARHLLAIGAYRSSEVGPSHPLTTMRDELRRADVAVVDVEIGPLSAAELGQLIADCVRGAAADVEELARLVLEKTAGNPFFVARFLLELVHSGHLRNEPGTSAWCWDIEAIRAQRYTDNVVDLMVGGMRRLLPQATQDAMKSAACMGSTVDARRLAIILERPHEAVHRDLFAGVREGFLQRRGDRYTFVHDRIQQAAYSLIPPAQRASVHLKVGRLLAASTPPELLEESVFDIVTHYRLGAALIDSPAERVAVARLQLLAGTKAKAAAAYASASRFLSAGLSLLDEQSWPSEHELTYQLHLELAQCEYSTGRHDEAERLLGAALERATTLVEKALAYRVKIETATTKGQMGQAVDDIIDCLRLFDIDVPREPSWDRAREERARVTEKMGGREIEDLLDLPPMADPGLSALLDVLAAGLPAALFASLQLECLIVCIMVNLSIEHGNTAASATAYVTMGMISGDAFQRYADGPRFGKVGCAYVERRDLLAYKAKTYIVMYHIMNFGGRYVGDNIGYLKAALDAAMETGDLATGCFCSIHIVSALLIKGANLAETHLEAERRMDFVRRAVFDDAADRILSMQRFIEVMRGGTAQFGAFDGGEFAEVDFECRIASERIPLMVCLYYILKLQARFMCGDHEEAAAAASAAEPLLWTSPSHIHVGEFWFYHALNLAASRDAPARAERIAEALAKYEVWATICPQNFRDKHALIAAEHARVTGSDMTAMRRYEEGICAAREGGFTQNEGVGYELAARFYRERGFESIANHYLREARRRYVRWGAEGKVRWLDARYPNLVDRQPISPTLTVSVGIEQLDFQSLVKSLQLISGEIVRSKLVSRLMLILVEHAGAQRGLFLVHHGSWTVEGEAGAWPARPGADARFPEAMLDHVRLSRTNVVLDDAEQSAFSADPYIAANRPRSVLCMPVVRQAEMLGVLYLESDLLPGLFTSDKLSTLELLISQAAISLENAALYSGLQRENAERRLAETALRASQERLQAAVEELTQLDHLKDQFLRVVAHELKTPVAIMKGYSEALAGAAGAMAPRPRRMLDAIVHGADRIDKIVTDVVYLSQLQINHLQLVMEPVELLALVRLAVSKAEHRSPKHRVRLVDEARAIVSGDRQLLQVSLNNLIDNAIKYSPDGGDVDVGLALDQERWAVASVTDEGVGIPREKQRRIFEPFYGAHTDSPHDLGGLGVGLYLCKEIVSRHGGRVGFSSEEGRGSRFWFALPTVAATAPPA